MTQKIKLVALDQEVIDLIGSGGGGASISLNTFSGNGSQTVFTLSSAPPSVNSLFITVEDVPQTPTTHFTLSGTTLTFTEAPVLGTNNIVVRWISSQAIGVPDDGSVSTNKLQDNAVTFDKIQDVTTNKLIGRSTAGSGSVEEISIGSGLSLSAGVLSSTGGGGGGAGGLKNRLINATFFVNQRQYTSGAATSGANQYTLDRWRVVTSGQNLSWSDSGGVRTVTAPAGGIEQVIEGSNLESGTYVISWTGTATCTVGGVAKASGDTTVVTGGANITIRFTGGTVITPQFELGSTPTSFEWRPYGLELALCQRYLAAIASEDTASAIAFGYAISANQADIIIPNYQELRAAPSSVVLSNPAHITVQYAAGTAAASSVAFSGVSSRKGCLVRITVASGLTAGQGIYAYFNNASGLIYFEGSEL